MPGRECQVRAVTYNIQWGRGRDGVIDLNRIARTVAEAGIICLQEVERQWRDQDYPDQVQRLAELLQAHDWCYGPAVDLSGGRRGHRRQLGNMTLSRWPITSVRNLPLPSWPVPGHMNDHQAMIEAVIDGPRPVRIYNTHLNYLSEEQRLDQVARLLAFIGEAPERGGPVSSPGLSAPGPEDDWIVLPDGKFPQMPQAAMLLGDFNMTPASAEYAVITSAGFLDALARAGLGPTEGVTFPGGGKEPPQRLDHVFLAPELQHAGSKAWIDETADGSDHQPVWCELDL